MESFGEAFSLLMEDTNGVSSPLPAPDFDPPVSNTSGLPNTVQLQQSYTDTNTVHAQPPQLTFHPQSYSNNSRQTSQSITVQHAHNTTLDTTQQSADSSSLFCLNNTQSNYFSNVNMSDSSSHNAANDQSTNFNNGNQTFNTFYPSSNNYQTNILNSNFSLPTVQNGLSTHPPTISNDTQALSFTNISLHSDFSPETSQNSSSFSASVINPNNVASLNSKNVTNGIFTSLNNTSNLSSSRTVTNDSFQNDQRAHLNGVTSSLPTFDLHTNGNSSSALLSNMAPPSTNNSPTVELDSKDCRSCVLMKKVLFYTCFLQLKKYVYLSS